MSTGQPTPGKMKLLQRFKSCFRDIIITVRLGRVAWQSVPWISPSFVSTFVQRALPQKVVPKTILDSQQLTTDDDKGKNVAGKDQVGGVTTLEMHPGESSSLCDFRSSVTIVYHPFSLFLQHPAVVSLKGVDDPLYTDCFSCDLPSKYARVARKARKNASKVHDVFTRKKQDGKDQVPDHSEIVSMLSMERTENAIWI
ncbi:hypothetical protein BU15DRAFT_84236 [Melanogaster broomeanus]|nr:hypothetical protein BU15DRAFT_84236 [Melanogaster broomeanus]